MEGEGIKKEDPEFPQGPRQIVLCFTCENESQDARLGFGALAVEVLADRMHDGCHELLRSGHVLVREELSEDHVSPLEPIIILADAEDVQSRSGVLEDDVGAIFGAFLLRNLNGLVEIQTKLLQVRQNHRRKNIAEFGHGPLLGF